MCGTSNDNNNEKNGEKHSSMTTTNISEKSKEFKKIFITFISVFDVFCLK